jgi:RimJ/RimL family protein N-acetyltransferase
MTRTDKQVGLRLRGRRVELRPLVVQDAASLLPSVRSEEVWRWKPVPRPTDESQMERLIEEVLTGPNGDRYPFLISSRSGARVLGSTTLHHVDLVEARAEIGWTWLARDYWGQGYNEETKLLLLRHCFETLGLVRVEFTVDDKNWRSLRALERMGFALEGQLRSTGYRLDGSRRDTIVYSVIATDWPSIRRSLQRLAFQDR